MTSQIGYLKLLIARSILSGPLDFEIKRVACSFNIWATTWQNQQNECTPSEDSDQPGHPPSMIRVFAVHKKAWVLSYPLSAQQDSDQTGGDAQADLSLRWAHTHFVGFVMSWLICAIMVLIVKYCTGGYNDKACISLVVHNYKDRIFKLSWLFTICMDQYENISANFAAIDGF